MPTTSSLHFSPKTFCRPSPNASESGVTAVSDVWNVSFRVANVKKSNNASNRDMDPKDLLHTAGVVRCPSSVSESTVTAVVCGAHTESDFSSHCLLAVQSRELASHLDTEQHALQI